MVTKYLGTEFDIHGGGLDLRFPHHENEMAQSQAAGHGFANFWMHNGMVTYRAKKCPSPSATPSARRRCWNWPPARVVRYYLGQAHYRSILDYRPTSLQEAAAAVERIEGFMGRARPGPGRRRDLTVSPPTERVPEAFAATPWTMT